MSELKAYNVVATADVNPDVVDNLGCTEWPAYDKEEADKVIAEKDAEIAQLQEQVHDYAQGLYVLQARAEKEARHQKYKRCVAMYHYCAIKALYELDFKGNDAEWKWYSKWMHKWFNLAEKFKEAK